MLSKRYDKRILACISMDDKHRLDMVAQYKQASVSQLIREAIRYMLLHVWLKEDKNE